MSVSRRFGLYGVTFNATTIGGITRVGATQGNTVRNEPTSAEVWARFQSLISQEPRLAFSTRNVAAGIDQCPLAGTDIDGLAAGLIFWGQLFADGGTRAGATSHRKYIVKDGIVVPRAVTCEHRGDASFDLEAVIGYDGTNNPITITESQTLPSVTDAQRFTIGAVTLESLSIPEIKSFNLDFGVTVEAESADSDLWPTHVSIISIAPVLTLRGIDLEWAKSSVIPLATGKAITHANTTVYLRKRAAGGTFVADGTAEHIKFTIDGLAVIEDVLEASEAGAAQCSLIVQARYDGTNDPLVIDTTSAIT